MNTGTFEEREGPWRATCRSRSDGKNEVNIPITATGGTIRVAPYIGSVHAARNHFLRSFSATALGTPLSREKPSAEIIQGSHPIAEPASI
jgi:hypothetical protein